MNCNREVVILKNVKSDYIEEAIIILKDGSAKNRGRALKEAEKIISDYGKRCEGIRPPAMYRQKKKGYLAPIVISGVLLISAVLLLLRMF